MYIEVPDEGMHEAAQKLTLGVDLRKKVVHKVGHSVAKRTRKKTKLGGNLLKRKAARVAELVDAKDLKSFL